MVHEGMIPISALLDTKAGQTEEPKKGLIIKKVEVLPELAHLEQVQRSVQGGLVEQNIMMGELTDRSLDEVQKSV